MSVKRKSVDPNQKYLSEMTDEDINKYIKQQGGNLGDLMLDPPSQKWARPAKQERKLREAD